CDEFVSRLPQGYETVLGKNAMKLSGGERQRISIARALLKNAPIILLDEAAASLDAENEMLIRRAMSKLIEGKTVLIIAHKLRSIEKSDKIIVLENGKIAAQGSHEEVMADSALYKRLYLMEQEMV
ncbi:MAG: ATP-binding cassette domain-containing protein, partial [Campylobacteraceae bacterium]|nr:ATP-binding cassette domain-containing protein [Campylobacteraceae bacterium]